MLLVGFGVMIVTFTLIRYIPGDPADALLGSFPEQGSEEIYQAYREMMGLDRPFLEQLGAYISRVVRGDLGTSLITRQSVNDSVKRAFPMTLRLIGASVGLSLVIALPLGVLAAIYRRTWFGYVFRVGTSTLLATPGFYRGLLLLLVFAIWLKVAPVAGYTPGFPHNIRSLLLPALTMSGTLVPIWARVLQSSISDTLEQEFVETAVVRGLSRPVFTWRYLLRPSLGPTVTLLGYMTGRLLGAGVIIELVFNLPGLGMLLVKEGLGYRDYPLVQGIILLFGLAVVVLNFLADALNEWLDPRTRTA
jgi:ABC-type dipeptide/oligopeptide/nickel transport system permease component